MSSTEQIISTWIKQHPTGRLYVAVGYVTVWGILWLAKQTPGRPVTLIVGDIRQVPGEASDADCRTAAKFLGRSDVEVRSWYRSRRNPQGQAMAHAKAWMVTPPDAETAVLLGSANLTYQGLRRNREMMGEASAGSALRLSEEMLLLVADSWDATENITNRLVPSDQFGTHQQTSKHHSEQIRHQHIPSHSREQKHQSHQHTTTHSQHHGSRPSKGCGTTVAAAVFMILGVLLLAATIIF